MLEPIHNQKLLSPQYKQQYLQPITADTSQIHKLIQEKYGKTVVLPETHSVEVKNFIHTPQGLIPQPSLNKSISLNQQSQIFPNQSIYPNNISNSLNFSQPINSQYPNNQSYSFRSIFFNQTRAIYNPAKVRPTI